MTSVLILLSGFDPGTYVIEDDGIANNGIAQLRGPDGSVIFFNIPTEFLTVTASAGRSVVFNLTESFGAADINVGSLTNAAENPDSISIKTIAGAGDVLLASNGSITESGADAAADITASTLILSASTGVGTSSLALETQVGTLEAETATGGINLNNLGNLVIGGLTDDVVGLDVETSGNLTLTNFGSIVLSEASPGGFESVHGGTTSGNVTLTANGFDSDIVSNVDQDAIAAPGGNITLTAGRDISMGTQGLNFDNDVRARGNLTITTGRDLNIDGFADLASDGFGAATGGDVIVNAGRDINVLNSTGTDGSLGAEGSAGGKVILTTGSGGFVRLLASSTSTVFSSTGDVEVNADRMRIDANAGISASGGQVTIQAVTEGWNVDLGSATDGAFALELSDAELDRIFTPTLNVGSLATGRLDVTSAISPASALNLILRASTDIGITGAMTVGGALTLRAGDNIFQLAASAITAGGAFNAFVDELGDDDGIGGIATANGTITAPSINFHGNAEKDTLNGASGDDVLNGNGGNDTLQGFGGADLLDGGTGADQMTGGLGDDEYIVDHAGDAVIEAVGEGNDSVGSSVTHTLDANVEDLTLTGSANINGTGNGLDNEITGNSGNNTLNGLAGADTLRGGQGNDIFIVDNVGDVVIETGAGTDLVQSSATFFALGANVENLTLTGGSAIDGTGNTLANILTGNGGANTLNGGGGADTMNGGLGNDIYVVDNVGDVVTETGVGTDEVQSTITFTLGTRFENLTLTGGAAIDGTGNTAANVLTGNGAANTLTGLEGNDTLDGGGGDDTMVGGLGNDTYIVGQSGDVVSEDPGEGTDLVESSIAFTLGANVEKLTLTGAASINGTGNSVANELIGNTGNNTLDGKAGADTMKGGLGNDTYVVNNAGDVATELAGEGTDTVQAAVTFTLASQLENLTLTGGGNINGTGNTIVNTLLGNGGNNILDGKLGADTMEGGAGDDTYVVDNAGDLAKEFVGEGTDTVNSSKTFTIANHVENLSLTGASNISGTGNVLANILTGNGADNTLSGLGGDDQIVGGDGDDDIFGGTGNDDLDGGTGADKFRFDTVLNAVTNVDELLGYSVADDTILLDRDIFTGIGANGPLAASAFVNGTSAGDANDRIIYDSANGNIFYDADGNGAGAKIRFAIVADGTALTSADFSAYL